MYGGYVMCDLVLCENTNVVHFSCDIAQMNIVCIYYYEVVFNCAREMCVVRPQIVGYVILMPTMMALL